MMNISKKPSNNIYLNLPKKVKSKALFGIIKKDNLINFIKIISSGYHRKISELISTIIEDDAVNILKHLYKAKKFDPNEKYVYYGGNPNVHKPMNYPLFIAIQEMSLDAFKFILSLDNKYANQILYKDLKPIEVALNSDYEEFIEEVVKELLKAGADPYAGNPEWGTPLEEAILKEYWGIVNMLIEYGKKGYDYYGIIENLIGNDDHHTFNDLIKKHRDKISTEILSKLLVDAIDDLSTNFIHSLINNGADPNYFNGETNPIIEAFKCDYKEAVRILINSGSDVDETISKGKYKGSTPMKILYGMYNNNEINTSDLREIISILNEYRSDVSIEKDMKDYWDIYDDLGLTVG